MQISGLLDFPGPPGVTRWQTQGCCGMLVAFHVVAISTLEPISTRALSF